MPKPELQHAMQQELQGVQKPQARKPKRGKGGRKRTLRQAMKLVQGRFPLLHQELQGPRGMEIAQSMVGGNGDVFASMERGLSQKRLGGFREGLDERKPVKAPSLDEFDL